MTTHASITELYRKLGDLNRILAEKESECQNIRTQRNAIDFAIGSLKSSTERR